MAAIQFLINLNLQKSYLFLNPFLLPALIKPTKIEISMFVCND